MNTYNTEMQMITKKLIFLRSQRDEYFKPFINIRKYMCLWCDTYSALKLWRSNFKTKDEHPLFTNPLS